MNPPPGWGDPIAVGQIYADLDARSPYRIEVVEVKNLQSRGIKVRNMSTGREHWTSMRTLLKSFRRVE